MSFKSPLRALPQYRMGQETALGSIIRSTYIDKVLSYSPIAYWVLNETAGATAIDQVNSPAQDGAYIGVTLGQPGIGDGNTCPFFDGANDYVDIYSVALDTAFDPDLYSVIAWGRRTATWDNARNDFVVVLQNTSDHNNRLWIGKDSPAGGFGRIRYSHYATGSTTAARQNVGLLESGWLHVGMTVSQTDNDMFDYLNGVQGAGDTGINPFVGALSANGCYIGRYRAGFANNYWLGYLAHVALFDRVLTPVEMVDLATV